MHADICAGGPDPSEDVQAGKPWCTNKVKTEQMSNDILTGYTHMCYNGYRRRKFKVVMVDTNHPRQDTSKSIMEEIIKKGAGSRRSKAPKSKGGYRI